jgi:DNA-binding MarR family transcriptional regulator
LPLPRLWPIKSAVAKTPFVMMNLLVGLYWFDEALESALKQHGYRAMGRQRSLVMMNLAIGETRPSRIARNLGITRQAMSQLIAQMEARGLVVVRPDPADGRAKIVGFSPKSTKIRDTAMKALSEFEAVLGERIGVGRLNDLRAALAVDWGPVPTEVPVRRARPRLVS